MLLCKHIKLTNCVHVLSLIQGSFAFCFHYDGRVMKLFFFFLPALAAGWVYRMGLLPIVMVLFI